MRHKRIYIYAEAKLRIRCTYIYEPKPSLIRKSDIPLKKCSTKPITQIHILIVTRNLNFPIFAREINTGKKVALLFLVFFFFFFAFKLDVGE